MSGGHWNYQDTHITEELHVEYLPKMLEALRKCFHEVDWSESCDTDRRTAEKRLYDIILELGDELFPT